MRALEQLQVLDVCAEQNTRLTLLLFPSDQMAGMDGRLDILEYADDRLDYLIVHNPAKHRGDLPRQVGAAAGAAGSARFARAAKKLIKAW